MRRALKIAVLQVLFVVAGCGGGSGSPPTPAISDLQPQWHTGSTPQYVAVELPHGFVATATMRSGRITGGFGSSAAVYYRGHITRFGTYHGDGEAIATFATWYNEVVGYSLRKPEGYRALVFENGTIKDLGQLPDPPGTPIFDQHIYDVPRVIGDRGDIYGDSSYGAVLEGFQIVKFHHVGPPQMLVPEFLAHGYITDINRSSTFTGEWLTGNPSGPFATIGYGLNLRLIAGYRASAATGINDRGDVTGYTDPINEDTNFSNVWRAFVWNGASLRLLPSLPNATQMVPSGINNDGDIPGSTCITYRAQVQAACKAFIYDHGTAYVVNALIPNAVGASEPDIALPGISDSGAFVIKTGSGRYLFVRPALDVSDASS